MRRKIVHRVSILMGVCVILGGCGGQTSNAASQTGISEGDNAQTEENSSESKESKTTTGAETDPVMLDWYINYSWYSDSWGSNVVSQEITDKTGVTINFVTPSGNEAEKLGALVASDSLPDLVTLGWWEPQLQTMLDEGMVYSLGDLADEYDPHFWESADETVVNWYTQPDGELYYYPNSATTPSDLEKYDNISANEIFMVRKDIYEAIGSPDMSTKEGFYEAVKKAAEMFPEVDGKPLIPIGAHVFNNEGNVSFDSYLMNFLGIPFEKDGALYDRYTDEEYLSWLKVFRKLGEEGYLADDIFVDQRTQMEEKIAEGRYFCMLYQYTDMADQQATLYSKNPDQIYIAVDGPRNENGAEYALPTTGINGWTVTLISKNCKDPERAIKMLDYMMSEEGQKVLYLGVEGVTYDVVDGEPKLKEEVKEILASDRKTYNELYGADDTYWMLQNNVMQLKWKQEPSEAIKQLQEWSYPYVVYNGQYDMPLPTGSVEANANAKILKLWTKTLQELLLADSDEEFDEIMEEFVAKREALGYADVMQMKWDLAVESKEKLGIKE